VLNEFLFRFVKCDSMNAKMLWINLIACEMDIEIQMTVNNYNMPEEYSDQ